MGERALVVLRVVFESHWVAVPIYEHRRGPWDVVFTSEPPSQEFSGSLFEDGGEVFIQLFDLGKMSGVIRIFPDAGRDRFWRKFKLKDPGKGCAWVRFQLCQRRRWVGTLNNVHPRPYLELEVLKGPWD